MSRLRGILVGGADEGPSWDDVEETLIAGDVGAALSIDLVEACRRRREPGGPEAAIRAARRPPRSADVDWSPRSRSPAAAVVLVVRVNRTGKTTTIGKLASRYAAEGRSVLLAAADTFRAAAIDQLRIWADRAKVPMIAHAPGADPGAVVYDAIDAAVARGADLVIVDTAGRLHTRSNLMNELSKVRRIIDKRLPGAAPETLFVLDATTGQNGLAQARAFHGPSV
jgi:fused signal recognition particle receptor